MTELASTAIFLPERLYAVVGRECNLYWDSVVSSIIHLDNFDYDVITTTPADTSRQQIERWTWTPGAEHVGDHTLTLDVSYAGGRAARRVAALRVRAENTVTPITRRVLVMGDSTSANGIMLSELVNISDGTGLTLALVGTRSAAALDAGRPNAVPPIAPQLRTVYHEAVSGKTIAWHYSDPASSFVFGGAFNFAQYLSANNLTLEAGDWILVNLGINDVFNFVLDTTCAAGIVTMTTRLNAMIAAMRAAVPGLRIGLCLTIPPAATQDAFGHEYLSSQPRSRYKRNRDMWVDAMLAAWTGQEASGVYLVPLHAGLDTRNNFPTETVVVNARNPALTVTRQTNGVHPTAAGYWQNADTLFAFLRGNEA